MKYTFNKLRFIKALFSPFKPFKLRFYAGKVAVGAPYFYPRKWIKSKKEGYLTAIPKKIGFDLVGLGWKTKWGDVRYEYSPLLSFVFFEWQVAILVNSPIEFESAYWESWVYYEYCTDKKKTKEERIKRCKEKAPQTWSSTNKEGVKIVKDYYKYILKERYL